MVRDIAFISLLVVVALLSLALYRKTSSFLGSATLTIDSVNELLSTLSEQFGRPPPEKRGLASRVGRLATSLLGLIRGRKKGSVSREG